MADAPIKRLFFFVHKRFFSATPLRKSSTIISETTTAANHITKTNSDGFIDHTLSSSFAVQYLVNSCGLPLKTAISAARKVQLEEKNKKQYDSVVSFLKSHEFSDTHVAKLLGRFPVVLCSRISSNIEPKLRLLTDNGVPRSAIPKIVISNANIFSRSLDVQLKPAMEFLKKYISCKEKLAVAIDRGAWLLTSDVKKKLQPNVDFLIKKGVPKHRIADLLVLQPRCVYQDIERMTYAVNMITSIGVKPNALVFIHTLRALLSLSELSWKRKVEVFESMGWSYDDVISMFVRSPNCFSCSEKNLRSTMDCLVNTVKMDPKTVIGYPKILMYSVEKRIVPRFTIWKILRERKLLSSPKFMWLLNESEKDFIDQFITKYSDKIPHLLSIYNRSKKTEKVSF